MGRDYGSLAQKKKTGSTVMMGLMHIACAVCDGYSGSVSGVTVMSGTQNK